MGNKEWKILIDSIFDDYKFYTLPSFNRNPYSNGKEYFTVSQRLAYKKMYKEHLRFIIFLEILHEKSLLPHVVKQSGSIKLYYYSLTKGTL